MTERLFLQDTYLFETDAVIVRVADESNGRVAVVLDRTVAHPQGGGQPADKGELALDGDNSASLPFSDVRVLNDDGEIGHFVDGDAAERLAKGQKLRVKIDKEHRMRCARDHSAGESFACVFTREADCLALRRTSD